MRKSAPAANPDAYVTGLDGWRLTCAEQLRKGVRSAAPLDEVVKWGHLVYLSQGPVLLIRAEEDRVLLGFWRGQRLQEIGNKRCQEQKLFRFLTPLKALFPTLVERPISEQGVGFITVPACQNANGLVTMACH